jgi:hypothetical protein
MECDVGMALCDMIYVPSLMKIDVYVQAILRLCLRNFRSSTVGISDGMGL